MTFAKHFCTILHLSPSDLVNMFLFDEAIYYSHSLLLIQITTAHCANGLKKLDVKFSRSYTRYKDTL